MDCRALDRLPPLIYSSSLHSARRLNREELDTKTIFKRMDTDTVYTLYSN